MDLLYLIIYFRILNQRYDLHVFFGCFVFLYFITVFSISMGAQQTESVDRNFPMQNYLNQGLNRNQVMMVRSVFNSYGPKEGRIQSQKYK
jgi:hypothetical protein